MKIKDFIKQLETYNQEDEILADFWLAQDICDNEDISLQKAIQFIKYAKEIEEFGIPWQAISDQLFAFELIKNTGVMA